MTCVEQPHSGWMRKSAPGARRASRVDVARADAGVDVALAVPDVHRAGRAPSRRRRRATCRGRRGSRVSGAVLGEDVLDDLDGVRRRHAVVGQRLDLGRRVDVHDGDGAGVLGLPGAQLVGGDRVGQRAAGVEVGDQDASSPGDRIDAVSAMKCTPQKAIVSASAAAAWRREPERVADVVGDVLDLGHLVVVGEDDGVALGGERAHLGRAARRSSSAVEGLGAVGTGAMGRFMADGSRMRERSRAGAECVSAPTEMKSTPVSAAARTVSSVMLPLASSSARPATSATIARIVVGRHVVEQDARRAGLQRLARPRRPSAASTSTRHVRATRARAARTAAPTPPAAATWFSLMRTMSNRPKRWLCRRPRRPRPSPAAAASASSCACRGSARRCPRPPRRSGRSASRRRSGAAGSSARCARRSASRRASPVDPQHRRRARASRPRGPAARSRRRRRAARNAASATSRPNTTPGAFWVIVRDARARRRDRRLRRDVAVADVLGERAGDDDRRRKWDPGSWARRICVACRRPADLDAWLPDPAIRTRHRRDGARRRRRAVGRRRRAARSTRPARSGAWCAGGSRACRRRDVPRAVRRAAVHGARRGRAAGRSPGLAGRIWTLRATTRASTTPPPSRAWARAGHGPRAVRPLGRAGRRRRQRAALRGPRRARRPRRRAAPARALDGLGPWERLIGGEALALRGAGLAPQVDGGQYTVNLRRCVRMASGRPRDPRSAAALGRARAARSRGPGAAT